MASLTRNIFGVSNPFSQLQGFDRGGSIDPFAAIRANLGARLTRGAGIFAQQEGSSTFDPTLQAISRNRSFQAALDSLSQGLVSLASQEGQFREGQRRFNVGTDINLADLSEQFEAGQTNIFDLISAGASGAGGLGSLLIGLTG